MTSQIIIRKRCVIEQHNRNNRWWKKNNKRNEICWLWNNNMNDLNDNDNNQININVDNQINNNNNNNNNNMNHHLINNIINRIIFIRLVRLMFIIILLFNIDYDSFEWFHQLVYDLIDFINQLRTMRTIEKQVGSDFTSHSESSWVISPVILSHLTSHPSRVRIDENQLLKTLVQSLQCIYCKINTSIFWHSVVEASIRERIKYCMFVLNKKK